MIKFENNNLIIHNTLDRNEAITFCKFLMAEKRRHAEDIIMIETSISYLEDKFGFEIEEILKNKQ